MVGAKRCPMGSGDHNANVDRVKAWRPDDWQSGGQLASEQLTALVRGLTRASRASSPRTAPLGRPYGAFCDAREAPISRAMPGAVDAAPAIGQLSELSGGSPDRPGGYANLDVEPSHSGADVFFGDGGLETGGGATAQSLDAMEYGVS